MDADLRTKLAAQFDVRLDTTASTTGMSGSRILTARANDGRACVLKVTVASSGKAHAARSARHEVAFYRDLAGLVPVRTPTFLASYEDDQVIAMLLSAHGAAVPATSWGADDWQALALDLAHLHATTVPEPDRWRESGSNLRALRDPDISMIEVFWRESLGAMLDEIVEGRDHIEQAMLQAGECFVHGDCHTDNILRERDALVWIDWQSAHVGNPAVELAFPSVRATPGGARIPGEVLSTYCGERGIDLEPMRRSVLAAELSIFIFEWPAYAGFNTDDECHRVRCRTHELAARWLQHDVPIEETTR